MAATFNAEPLPPGGSNRQSGNTRPAAASVGGAVVGGGVASDSAIAAHEAAANPHPGYETPAEVNARIATHSAATDPHGDRAYTDAQIAAIPPSVSDLDGLTDVDAPAPTNNYVLTWNQSTGTWIDAPPSSLVTFTMPCGTDTTVVAVGTGKASMRLPHPLSDLQVRASLVTAQASGSLLTVDLKANGTSVFSTLLTLDNTERTSFTAAAPCAISAGTLPDDTELVVDITQVGAATVGAGLKVYVTGRVPLTLTGDPFASFVVWNYAGLLTTDRSSYGRAVTNSGVTTTTSPTDSLVFNGTSYLRVADAPAMEPGSSDFCFEWIMTPTSFATDMNVLNKRSGASVGPVSFVFPAASPGRFNARFGNTGAGSWSVDILATSAMTVSTENHVAVTRSGSTWTIWLNGVAVGSTTSTFTIPDTADLWYSGTRSDALAGFVGRQRGFRMTVGRARYTATFVPPTTLVP